jgi:hypothetical protein
MRKCAINAVALLLSVIVTVDFYCRAQSSQPTKYQIEAAYIFNFARFVDWPAQAFSNASAPMVIGVLGKNRFGTVLQDTVSGKVIRGHPLRFKQCASVPEAARCQILFISDSEKSRFRSIIGTLNGATILTVSDADGFIQAGGMIDLRIIDQKLRFDINNSAAKSAGLTISSKLLSLAITVR